MYGANEMDRPGLQSWQIVTVSMSYIYVLYFLTIVTVHQTEQNNPTHSNGCLVEQKILNCDQHKLQAKAKFPRDETVQQWVPIAGGNCKGKERWWYVEYKRTFIYCTLLTLTVGWPVWTNGQNAETTDQLIQ